MLNKIKSEIGVDLLRKGIPSKPMAAYIVPAPINYCDSLGRKAVVVYSNQKPNRR